MIWALGTNHDLTYHRVRGSKTLDLLAPEMNTTASPNSSPTTTRTPNRENLDAEGNYVLEWGLSGDGEMMEFQIEVKNAAGYIGFGISPNMTMAGADILIVGMHGNGTVYYSVSYLDDDFLIL